MQDTRDFVNALYNFNGFMHIEECPNYNKAPYITEYMYMPLSAEFIYLLCNQHLKISTDFHL